MKHGQPYTKAEDRYIREAYPAGEAWEAMSQHLGRSRGAIENRAHKLGLMRPGASLPRDDVKPAIRALRTCRSERDIARLYKRAGRDYGLDDVVFRRPRPAAE